MLVENVHTIKDFQFVKLLLAVKHLHVNVYRVGGQDTQQPGARLGVRVVFGKPWTQDHPRGP